ncbi:hypothetical protein DOO74_08020 [Rhodobacteraceae bacterium AsT-22]|nr:hypothetical protein DOO74_08020 [Rhodobacteraceae bacterium AsT-22]
MGQVKSFMYPLRHNPAQRHPQPRVTRLTIKPFPESGGFETCKKHGRSALILGRDSVYTALDFL